MSIISPWKEIVCDYLDEKDLFWRVDAWTDPEEENNGEVIAYIDDLTGRVLYTDPIARVDEKAQEVIKDKVLQIQNKVKEAGSDFLNLGQ